MRYCSLFDNDMLMFGSATSTSLNLNSPCPLLTNRKLQQLCQKRTSCDKVMGRKSEFRRSRMKAEGGNESESPVLTSDPSVVRLSKVMMCCNMFTVKQPPGTPLGFRKRLQWRHSGTQLGGDGECVCVCVYMCVCGCWRVCLVCGFIMIETNHNIAGETDKRSRETNDESVNGDVKEDECLMCVCIVHI